MLSLFVAISVSLNARARLGTAVVRGLSRTAGAVMVVGAADIVGEVDNWRPEGGHGTGNRFMPLDTVAMGPGPMLMAIAGLYPGLTAAELRAPQPLPFAPAGGWNYHRLLADGVPTGFVALPGNELVAEHPDTVAVVCDGTSLGVEFADGASHEHRCCRKMEIRFGGRTAASCAVLGPYP